MDTVPVLRKSNILKTQVGGWCLSRNMLGKNPGLRVQCRLANLGKLEKSVKDEMSSGLHSTKLALPRIMGTAYNHGVWRKYYSLCL